MEHTIGLQIMRLILDSGRVVFLMEQAYILLRTNTKEVFSMDSNLVSEKKTSITATGM